MCYQGVGEAPTSKLPVIYDSDLAAQQILKSPTNVTPGGRTITYHAAERMVNQPITRGQTSMQEIDEFLDGVTKVRKITPHPAGDTITLRNINAPRIKEITVMLPQGSVLLRL